MSLRTAVRPLLLLLLGAAWTLAAAQDLPVEAPEGPAVLTADTVTADEALGLVTAEGRVEIQQAGRLLRADRVVYNRRTGIVAASGNVILVEPTGDVAFADYVELQQDLATGFIDNISLLLSDESRVIAASGIRENGRTVADRAVYSPCRLCPDNPRRPPLWQIRAAQVIHDEQTKDVVFRNAFLDVFGVPVAYTPYLRHPDPSVRQRSGLLAPRFGTTADLGPFVNAFYYWAISPSQDATAQINLTRRAGVLLGSEYRRRFEHGQLLLDGSVNFSERLVDEPSPSQRLDDRLRGHLFGNTRFDLGPHWRAGGDLEWASDETYLETFDISDEDVLESRAFLEGFYGLSYTSAEVIGFQDLRAQGIDQPLVLPWLQQQVVSRPGALLGGQWHVDASLLDLVRQDEVGFRRLSTEGVDTRRLSVEGGWTRTDYTDFGLVANVFAALRGDLYWSDDMPDPLWADDMADPLLSDATRDGVLAGRFFPRVGATARYPLVRQQGRLQQLIEPIVAVTAAPDVDNSADIPNNDSAQAELDELNLFSDDVFPGLDRVEDGVRLSYGLNLGLFGPGGAGTLFVGQSFRLGEEDEFDPASGLEENWSDIVGRMTLDPSPLFSLDWRFRFDDEDFSSRRQEVSATGGPEALRLRATYVQFSELDAFALEEDQEEIFVGASSRFADYWTASASIRRDLEDDATRSYTLGLSYSDECFTFGAVLERRFTQDRDLDPGTSVYFTVALRNLGDVPFSIDAPELFN